MARPRSPQWKYDLIKVLAQLVNFPGGSYLLRNQLAYTVSGITGWTHSTVCKYTEIELKKYFRSNW